MTLEQVIGRQKLGNSLQAEHDNPESRGFGFVVFKPRSVTN